MAQPIRAGMTGPKPHLFRSSADHGEAEAMPARQRRRCIQQDVDALARMQATDIEQSHGLRSGARDTRRVVAFCLDTCTEGDAREPARNNFGIARL